MFETLIGSSAYASEGLGTKKFEIVLTSGPRELSFEPVWYTVYTMTLSMNQIHRFIESI